MRTLIAAACLAFTAACSEKVSPPPAAPLAAAPIPAPRPAAGPAPATTPSAEDKAAAILMRAVYGENYRAVSGDALAELPNPDDRSSPMNFVVSPVAHTVLPTGETVLVANAEFAAEDGTAQSAHANGGLLNVYLMRQEEGQWKILKRHENVATLGSHGQLGTVQWVTLAKDKPGLAVLSGGTWQGYTVENLAVFDLTANIMRELTGEHISIHSDSDGGCDPEGEGECWSVTGKWRFEPAKAAADYDDIVIDFSGQTSKGAAASKGQPATPRVENKVTGKARYAYDGKAYKLVEGANPVPGV